MRKTSKTPKHACDNCGKEWDEKRLSEPKDLWQRLDPGSIVPSGECPDCGALCYPNKGKDFVHVVIHKFDDDSDGPSIDIFRREADALKCFRGILKDYVANGYDINPNAKNGTELYEASNGEIHLSVFEAELG